MTTAVTAGFASDAEIARRVLAHIDAGTTDEGEPWREPVAHYLDPLRFGEELALLRSRPSVFVPSAAIPAAGDHLARTAFGVPLFAVRDRDGRARVFRNACRHRGVAVVEGRGCARSLVCPYHGWTYRLDGSLAHVPHADAFPELDGERRGLVEVPSDEVDGLVVIAGVEPSATGHPRLDTLTARRLWHDVLAPGLRLIDVSTAETQMSWKVLVEQFLEGYHIRSTHRETFFPVQYDDLNVVEFIDHHARVTYPYRNIERLRDRPESVWTVRPRVTFVYHLFPNVMVATFPDQVTVIVVDPVDVARSRLTTYTMSERAPGDRPVPTQSDGGRSLRALAAREDNAMSLGVQGGLASGANTFLEFGRHESAIGHFHRNLTALLAPPGAVRANAPR